MKTEGEIFEALKYLPTGTAILIRIISSAGERNREYVLILVRHSNARLQLINSLLTTYLEKDSIRGADYLPIAAITPEGYGASTLKQNPFDTASFYRMFQVLKVGPHRDPRFYREFFKEVPNNSDDLLNKVREDIEVLTNKVKGIQSDLESFILKFSGAQY